MTFVEAADLEPLTYVAAGVTWPGVFDAGAVLTVLLVTQWEDDVRVHFAETDAIAWVTPETRVLVP